MKLYTWVFFENLSRKFKFHLNPKKTTGTLHADQYTFLIISQLFLLRTINVTKKKCSKNQLLCFITFFPPKIVSFVRYVKILYSRTDHRQYGAWAACWITKENTHTLKICTSNSSCFSTATMVAGTRLSVTLHVNCLPCDMN
jgi:hypothetical protein